MKAPRIGLTLLPLIAMLAIPVHAPAAYLVPPENSAATQYTEAYPTAGGNRNIEATERRNRSPEEVLGGDKARKLESQGPAGEAAAELAAATAPIAAGVSSPASGDRRDGGADGAAGAEPGRDAAAASEGSSPLGEVIGEATGSSSDGGMGLLLPLAIVAAIVWAMAYLWRDRKRQTA